MTIELLLAPDCPNASAARAVLTAGLARLGLVVRVRERVGDFPSPTILVDGIDVVTGERIGPAGPTCRLDLPTAAHVMAALEGVRS